ncbi:MAG: hypothetical protein PHD43_07525 [Methylococcales bacterium]|nr:hypothetical protein [Methylococcales bacterium]
MNSENIISAFENAIEKAFADFDRRLKQQELFQVQTKVLTEIQSEVVKADYYQSEQMKNISISYKEFYEQLKGTGRSYENIIAEKSLVDTYSAFEKFLSDCFYAIYEFYPKYLGELIQVNTVDFLVDSDIELCKKNVIESKVRSIIQPNNISVIIDEFKKSFNVNKIDISDDDKSLLYEVSLVRNLVIHNNSIVNRIYKETVKKIKNPKYDFTEGDTVLYQLDAVLDDAKNTVTRVSEKIKKSIIDDASRLNHHHSNK